MVMVEYVYGTSNTKAATRTSTWFTIVFVASMNCQHHELESVDQIYMLFTLFTHIQLHVELNIPGDPY